MRNFYKNKKILITGGTGLIGIQLSKELHRLGAKITVVSLERNLELPKKINFLKTDLRKLENCIKVTKNMDYVFHLAGIKGSPKMTKMKPYSFMTPMMMFNINMLDASRVNKVKRFLYTSSIGVYNPSKIMKEKDVWNTFPSYNDWYSGWAKRVGELQAEAYEIQYKWKNISIVRPANVYGPYDNFDPENAMVIPSLISRASSGERPLKVWGDGSPIRDFIYSEDVASGMMKVMELAYNKPVNLGSGNGVTIREIADNIANLMPDKCEVIWDTSKPSGDKKRIMNTERAESIGIKPEISLHEGIKKTIEWYNSQNVKLDDRYNAFTDKSYL